jgi:hypothetical protein
MKRRFFAVSAAFALTIGGARLFSLMFPRAHLELISGLRIHHYVYGILILTAAGYLALIFKSARATTWIALLYGLGVGLTFDEFGMWFNPPFVRGVRWNMQGVTAIAIVLGIIGIITFLRTVSRSTTDQRQPTTGENPIIQLEGSMGSPPASNQ